MQKMKKLSQLLKGQIGTKFQAQKKLKQFHCSRIIQVKMNFRLNQTESSFFFFCSTDSCIYLIN